MSVAEALQGVRTRIQSLAAEAGRKVRLVAVSKTKPGSAILECYDAGQRSFGENYVQELAEKAPQLPPDIRWHFIGHLQSNKAKIVAKVPNLYLLESIDSVKLANAVNKQVLPGAQRAWAEDEGRLRVMVQVNTSGEASKSGVEPGPAVTELCRHVATECNRLRLVGLMTIGRLGDVSPECFRTLVECRDQVLAAGIPGAPKTVEDFELSMGMSGDYPLAIELGSTNVRVGSTIFGARDYAASKPKAAAAGESGAETGGAPGNTQDSAKSLTAAGQSLSSLSSPGRRSCPPAPPSPKLSPRRNSDPIRARLQKLDIDSMTPLEAIQELSALGSLARK